ncbi:hypothetical protein D3C80_1958690 [compost metagenome]
MTGNDLGNLGQRVENTGAGFAVDQRHMGDARVCAEQAVNVFSGGRLVFCGFKRAVGAAQHFADLRQALTVSAVDQHQDLAIAWHQGADGCLHGEGAAAL